MLTPAQLEDLAQVHAIADRFKADIVIIGAAALLCFMDIGRFTRDIDVVLALDLEGFTAFADELRTLGWTQEERREHRWRGPSGSIIDLLPAGPKLRQARRITWPKSDFEMSLVGFEHIFVRALSFTFAEGIQYRVVPSAGHRPTQGHRFHGRSTSSQEGPSRYRRVVPPLRSGK